MYTLYKTAKTLYAVQGNPPMSLLLSCWGQVPFNYEMNRHHRTAQSLFGLIIGDSLGRRCSSRNFTTPHNRKKRVLLWL